MLNFQGVSIEREGRRKKWWAGRKGCESWIPPKVWFPRSLDRWISILQIWMAWHKKSLHFCWCFCCMCFCRWTSPYMKTSLFLLRQWWILTWNIIPPHSKLIACQTVNSWNKGEPVEQWKRAPSCVGYMSGMTSYPVRWGLFLKPWNKDPYEIIKPTRIQAKVRSSFLGGSSEKIVRLYDLQAFLHPTMISKFGHTNWHYGNLGGGGFLPLTLWQRGKSPDQPKPWRIRIDTVMKNHPASQDVCWLYIG